MTRERSRSEIPAVTLRDVTKVYGGHVRALDHASFDVEVGEHCCLLGPNGAGKTTIVRLLEGALVPTGGAVELFGHRVGSAGLSAKQRTGVVPQNPGLYPDLTVREYLTLVRDLYRTGAVEETAEIFALAPYLDRPLSALSGGYQRRLLVAAAVLSAPDLLLLDEPTVGLDPLAASDVRKLLAQAMRDRTVLMSTHNLAEAEELCDTVIIIRSGSVLIHERIEDLKRQTVPRVHITSRQDRVALAGALADLGHSPSLNEKGVWLSVADPEAEMPRILRLLLSSGIDVYESRIVPATLEDLFVEAVTQ